MVSMPDEANLTLPLLMKLGGATQLIAHVGQVLVHSGHVPPGCYVMVRGTMVVSDGLRMQFVRVARGAGPVLVPPVEELDRAARHSVHIEIGTHVMYLPRSILLSDPGTARALQQLGLQSVSLQSALP
jgi:hypothetical protein